ncbi:hypothetical protein EVJ58_g3531 [Rhodofomes roseus]|uniref:C-8 sterol isomerase n=1 Tax=Rhodofomes roseus TaxID=34475 RepID=A0A4Y9YK78_9APHY|nr:hypothetical protein EVJ58_g3531 [Rhodofomes roseus]
MASKTKSRSTSAAQPEGGAFTWATKWFVRMAWLTAAWAVCKGLDAVKVSVSGDVYSELCAETILAWVVRERAAAAAMPAYQRSPDQRTVGTCSTQRAYTNSHKPPSPPPPEPNDINYMIDYIVTNLTSTYGSSQIALNTNSSEWVLSNAGGAMGAMYIIHASVTEYLIVFGTPLGTEGHTGMHTADDYFNILVGEQWAFAPPSLEMERYPAGSVHHLPRGHVKQYKMHEGCYALEYARGWIPLMLPFGLADVFTSTLDVWSLYHTVRITAREMLRNFFIGKV